MITLTPRRLLALTAVLGTITCLCATTFAQQPGARPGGGQRRGFGGFGGGQGRGGGRQMSVAALPIATLDAIVKLTPAQKTKITPIHDNFVKSAAAFRPQPGQRPDPSVMQKMMDLNTQATKDIEAVLTPAQKTKLEAARKEMGLYRLAGIPLGLYGQIKLTGDQRTKLQTIQQGMMSAQPGGDRQAMRAAMQAARQNAAAVLTPAQTAQIAKYLQEHPEEAQRGRGFGGGGRRGGGR